jgi:hypothetical protein
VPIENVLSAKGLQTTPNNLGAGSVGALVEAANVMIRYPDVIEPRRGQQFYATSSTGSGNIEQMMLFEDTVVVHTAGGRIDYYDGDVLMETKASGIEPARDDQRLKWAVSARNLNLCTDAGVQIIETLGADFRGLRPSGLPFPTQPFTELYTSATGSENWLDAGNAVSYRIVFGYVDVHDRLYLGPPSPFSVQVRNDTASTKAVRLRIDTWNLPQISTGDLFPRLFLQVYRTAEFAFATAEPNEEFYLVTERFFQPGETVFVTINDTSPTNTLGAKLYTNPTAEGDGQQNNAPPFARDIASWDDRLWYANTEQPQSATLQIVGVGPTGVQVGDKLRLANLDGTRAIEMEAVAGAPSTIYQFTLYTGGTAPQNVDVTTTSLVYNINDFFLNPLGAQPPCRAFLVPGSATSPTTMFLQKADGVQGDRQQFTLSLIPAPLPFTAILNPPQITIVSATDAGYAAGDTIYLTSGALKETRTILSSGGGPNVWNLSGGPLPVAFATGTTTRSPFLASRAWNPQLPIYGFEELDVTSSDDRSSRRLYYSKAQLPEGVPLLNYIDVGTSGKDILRIWPNRNRLIVFKEEGTYVVYGEYGSYAVQLLDDTVQLLAPDSIAAVGSTVFALVDDGVVAINESSLVPVSEVINAQLAPYLGTLGRTQVETAFGVAHESDQLYSLWMPDTTPARAIAYVYGVRSQSWTNWVLAGACGLVNPANDTLYWAGADSRSVFAEAHQSRRSDYVDILTSGGALVPIECRVTYASTTFGNPSATKQAREIHAHFRQAAFQTGSFTLTTDISTGNSASIPVAPGSVYNVTTNNPFIGPPVAPVQFRKLIPQEHQRATYYNWTLIVNEPYAYWALNGISTVFETTSERTGTVR